MSARSFPRGTMIVSFDRGVPPSVSAANLPPIDGPFCRGQAARNYSRDRKGLRSFSITLEQTSIRHLSTVCSPDCDMLTENEPSKSESTVPEHFERMMKRRQLRMVRLPQEKKKCGPPNDHLELFDKLRFPNCPAFHPRPVIRGDGFHALVLCDLQCFE